MLPLTWLYTVQYNGPRGLIPFFSSPPHHAPALDLSCPLPPFHLACLPPLCTYANFYGWNMLLTNSPLLAHNSTTLLPLSFSPGTQKASVIPVLILSPIHSFRSPRIHTLHPFPTLSRICSFLHYLLHWGHTPPPHDAALGSGPHCGKESERMAPTLTWKERWAKRFWTRMERSLLRPKEWSFWKTPWHQVVS